MAAAATGGAATTTAMATGGGGGYGGEYYGGYTLPPAAHSGPGKRKRNAARDALPLSHCGPQSVDEAWREHTHRVNCARQQAEAEGLVFQQSIHSASGYKGVAINRLPQRDKDRPRPYQGYVVRGDKKVPLGYTPLASRLHPLSLSATPP